MNYKEFTEAFINKFDRNNKGIEIIKYWNKEKSFIMNYPFRNINIEVKPNNSGIFVIQFMDFEFFDYALLKGSLEIVLHHENANFRLISKCIYIYPNQRENVELCINILNYTTETILKTISQIKN